MLEHCDHCQDIAPHWDPEEYESWHIAVTAERIYLGVICEDCFAGEEMAFIGVQIPPGSPVSRSIMLGSLGKSASDAAVSAAASIVTFGVSSIQRLNHLRAHRSYSLVR